MNKDRGLRRFRPRLERLEVRDLPSTLQVVGPNPNDRGAKGPFLNLIVVKDSSPSARAGAPPIHRTRQHATPAHPRGPLGPGRVVLSSWGLLDPAGAGSQVVENSPRRHP